MRFFKRKQKESIEDYLAEFRVSGCALCRPLARGASSTRTFHFPNKDTVQMELVDERRNPNRKCLSLCVLDDPTIGWAECPVKYCPRCGCNLLSLIRQEAND